MALVPENPVGASAMRIHEGVVLKLSASRVIHTPKPPFKPNTNMLL